MAADERTSLIRNGSANSGRINGSGPDPSKDAVGKSSSWGSSRLWRGGLKVENRILLAGFLVTLSFSFTQVP
jgi:hypothetical protein